MLRGLNQILGFLGFRQKIVDITSATYSVNANQSGFLFRLARAAGSTVTLPLAQAGMWFDFFVDTSVTSNAYKIITGAATEFLSGGYTSVDTDTSNAVAFFTGNGSTHIAVNMTAASSNALGGLRGTKLRFTCVTTTLWNVEGVNMGGGTVATAFSTT
jgi:hypothetical protein